MNMQWPLWNTLIDHQIEFLFMVEQKFDSPGTQ